MAIPPRPSPEPRALTIHGDTRVDEFYWLRDRERADVIAHLEAENAYARAVMAPHKALEDELYAEMLGRIQETDLSVPVRRDDWLYYTRTEEGKQYGVLCRRRDIEGATEQVLIDQNALAEGQPYYRLGDWAPSPDHRLIAWVEDVAGDERYVLHVLDTERGERLPDRVVDVAGQVEWAADGEHLYYVTMDAAQRPFRVHVHRLGAPHDTDVILYEELDATYFLSIGLTRSRRFVLIHLASHSASEVRLLHAAEPLAPPVLVEPRRPNIEYSVEHHGDRLLIVTNDGAVNFRLVEAPVATPGREHWREVLPGRERSRLHGVDAFERHLVTWELEEATPQVTIQDLASGERHRIAFPEEVYAVQPAANPDFASGTLRFTYTSMVTPASVIDYHMAERRWEVRKVQPVLGGYDPTRYRTERVFVEVDDGVRIPVSAVYRTPFERDGTRPMLLQGYGSYGITFDPQFSSNAVSLLDRGFVVAIAHVRGGEELGRPWYETGKLLAKRNTFSDFVAVAEHFVRERWTASDRLVINGGSAGGLLVGAAANLRPDLFAGVVAEVPFVDVVTTMLDESIPLTVLEYEEWGNPNEHEFYHYIKSYSPYDNVRPVPYPAMLVTAGLHDPRVAYWEPAKWVARLRAVTTGTRPILLRTNMGAGHGGASGRYDHLREVAFKYAFVLTVVSRQ